MFIGGLRLPDENLFFQESIFIWHFNANLVQNTNSQDDNDSNSQLRIVFEREGQKLCEQWPKYRIFWRYLKDKVETQWLNMLLHCISVSDPVQFMTFFSIQYFLKVLFPLSNKYVCSIVKKSFISCKIYWPLNILLFSVLKIDSFLNFYRVCYFCAMYLTPGSAKEVCDI